MAKPVRKPVIVVTGGGQGMGRSAALYFAQRGWDCVLIGRTEAKLRATAQEVAALGGQAQTIAADLTDLAAVAALAEQVAAADCLANFAGVSLIRPITETTAEDWERVHNTNVRAPYFVIKALLPHLLKSDNPTIVNIGSVTTFGGYAEVSAYTASKTAILGLTRALAAELQPQGVRVVLLAPGPADTPMRWAATPDYDRRLLITPETIAEAVFWLATLPRHVITSEFMLRSSYL